MIKLKELLEIFFTGETIEIWSVDRKQRKVQRLFHGKNEEDKSAVYEKVSADAEVKSCTAFGDQENVVVWEE